MYNAAITLFLSKAPIIGAIIGGHDACGGNNTFFGLIPWYYYLPNTDLDQSTCSIRSFHFFGSPPDLPLVLLAVVDDLLRIAGIVAVAFVIVGAIRYITSQGNPDDAAKAQSTIINALIGVALATVAIGIVNYLGGHLGQ